MKYHPNLRIHCDFSVDPGISDSHFTINLPTERLVTLKLLPLRDACHKSRSAWRYQFENIICSSPNLETLHIRSSGTYSPYIISASHREKKFPPIRELCVEMDWRYSARRFARTWDFSKLSVLKLRNIDLDNFVAGVPLEQLSGLTKFEFLLRGQMPVLRHNQINWVDHLVKIICNIHRLEELIVECYDTHELLPALAKHKPSLQILTLRDLNNEEPQVATEDVENLRVLFPHLQDEELEIRAASLRNAAVVT
jgi:hypothetical protein